MSNIVRHKRTNIESKKPTSEILSYGEIALNYKNSSESIFIKNDNDEIVEFKTINHIENIIDDKVNKLITNTELKFFCIEPVTVTINGEENVFEGNTLVDMFLKSGDEFSITTTSNNSIYTLNAWPGALGTYYEWLEGVNIFDGILFDMNNEEFYTKWSQGNQGLYHVQFAQYKNCIFWSDNTYVSDVSKRTNYTLYYTSELPLCYSTIRENTFKSFYFAYNVTSDPNWSNPAYKESFAAATWATQVFSYYGLHSIGLFDMDSSEWNITLPKDCRGLMFYAPNILNAGVFDAINVTNFGAKSGSWRDAFAYCYQLQNLYIKNLKVNLNVSWSPINQQSLEFILTEAANTTKITISLSPYTWYRLTESNKTLASEKNITLEMISSNTTDDNRLTMLQMSGDGNSYLANDGTYKPIEIPTVPTKVSELENDSNYVNREEVESLINNSGGGGGNNGEGEIIANNGTILFQVDATSANFSDITLSNNVSNYERLDICAVTDVGEALFTSIYNPQNSIFNLSSNIQESGELIIKSKQYEIYGTNITSVSGVGGMCSVSSNGIVTTSGNYIGIYKVIGY